MAMVLMAWVLQTDGQVHNVVQPEVRKELLVRFKKGIGEAEKRRVLAKHGEGRQLRVAARKGIRAHQAGENRLRQTSVLRVETDEEGERAIVDLRANAAVEFVEPNQPLKLFATPQRFPSDFEFQNLYGLHNTGEQVGTADADIDAPEGWEIATGSRQVLVAVIDTGIDYFHEDLRENTWTNAGEIDGNGVDDDGNGYIDDVHGYDFVSNDQDPMDDHMHGTHVAGIIGAKGNNDIGVVGVCWEVTMMALKAFDERGGGTLAEALEAIDYAIANGAQIINASWGVEEKSRALEEALGEVEQNGILFVAAAGNNRSDEPAYPAAVESALAVAATDSNDLRAGFSNHGSWVDIAAPGTDILSTVLHGEYDRSSGTSMAAPYVTGAAALLLSRRPELNPAELRRILVNTADYIVADTTRLIGNGRLNVERALRVGGSLPEAKLEFQKTIQGFTELQGKAFDPTFAGYAIWGGKGNYPTNWQLLAVGSSAVASGLLASFDSSLLGEGPVTLRLNVSNAIGAEAVDYLRTRVQNLILTAPQSGDIMRPGMKYEIRGNVFGKISSYEVQYGVGVNPNSWQTITEQTSSGVLGGRLGEWDTSSLAPNQPYSLRLVAKSALETNTYVAAAIWLDETFREGWPQHLPISGVLTRLDWRNVRAADLDGDGTQELVIIDSAGAAGPELKVFANSGELVWSKELPQEDPKTDIPVITDLDGDGRLELIVDAGGKVFVFDAEGNAWGGNWPLSFPGWNAGKAVADVNGDGDAEIVMLLDKVISSSEAGRELRIYNREGELVRQWYTKSCAQTNDVQEISPAIANLDGDPELEIVVPWGCNEIALLDISTSEPVWRTAVAGRVLITPVIGDVDRDGSNDIVVACTATSGRGGVYVLHADGAIHDGWPALENETFFTQPALGDCDGDGKLEIALANGATQHIHLLQADGFEVEGWPISNLSLGPRNSVGFFDFTGDELPEVIVGSAGYSFAAVISDEPEYWGGLRVFSRTGKPLELGTGKLLPVEASSGATWNKMTTPVVTDLDGNGKIDLITTSIQDRTFGVGASTKGRSTIYVRELELPYKFGTNSWPMLGGNLRNTSHLPFFPAAFPEPTNGPTKALPDRVAVVEDNPLEIDAVKNDLKPGDIWPTLLSVGTTTNGNTELVNNRIFYMPKTNFFGLNKFEYLIEGSDGLQSTGLVKVFVRAVNDPPVLSNQVVRLNRNTSIDVIYAGRDPDQDRLTYSIPRGPEHGELWNYPTIGNYVPAFGFSGTDSFTLVASDGKYETAPAVITIEITSTNNPPRPQAQNLIVRTNASLHFTLRATDPDKDEVTYIITSEPKNGSLQPSGNGYLYEPVSTFKGEDKLKFRASDGMDLSEEAEVVIKVTDENTAPIANSVTLKLARNATNEIVLRGFDPEGASVTFAIASEPTRGLLVGDPPRLSYIPAANFTGPDRFTFTVNDGVFTSTAGMVSIKVGSGNHSPSLESAILSGSVNAALEFSLRASDPENDPLRTVILRGPKSGRVIGTGTNLVYRPQIGFQGQDSFTCRVWDGSSYSPERKIEFTIHATLPPVEVVFESVGYDAAEDSTELVLAVPAGKPLRIYSSENLVDWSLELSTTTDTSGTLRFVAPGDGASSKFYRATAE